MKQPALYTLRYKSEPKPTIGISMPLSVWQSLQPKLQDLGFFDINLGDSVLWINPIRRRKWGYRSSFTTEVVDSVVTIWAELPRSDEPFNTIHYQTACYSINASLYTVFLSLKEVGHDLGIRLYKTSSTSREIFPPPSWVFGLGAKCSDKGSMISASLSWELIDLIAARSDEFLPNVRRFHRAMSGNLYPENRYYFTTDNGDPDVHGDHTTFTMYLGTSCTVAFFGVDPQHFLSTPTHHRCVCDNFSQPWDPLAVLVLIALGSEYLAQNP